MGEKLLLPVLIAIELLAVFIAMTVWTKRMLKKGRKLKENAQSPKTSLVHRSRNSMMTTRMLSDKEKKVKIGSSLGFTAYIGATGFSLKIKTSFVESDGKKSLITRHS